MERVSLSLIGCSTFSLKPIRKEKVGYIDLGGELVVLGRRRVESDGQLSLVCSQELCSYWLQSGRRFRVRISQQAGVVLDAVMAMRDRPASEETQAQVAGKHLCLPEESR